MRWFWGFLLLLVGFVMLGNNLSWWKEVDLGSLWAYWPLLLIIIGLAIITKHWRFNYIVMILVVLASLGFIYYTGIFAGEKILLTTTSVSKTDITRDTPESIKKAKINLNVGAIKVNVNGSTDKLVSGNYQSNLSSISINEKISGDTIEYTIENDKNFRGISHGRTINELNFKLSNLIPIDLSVNAGASSIDLDLREQKITGLNLDSGASTINLTLGTNVESGAKIAMNTGASKFNIKVPKDIGANIKIDAPVSSNNFNKLKQLNKNEYQTDNFDTVTKKIYFEIKAGASSFDFSTF